MAHPLVDQLRFTRSEWLLGLEGVSEEDGSKHFEPMNCVSWIVGHLAWQEQRYFLYFAQGQILFPEMNVTFAYGAPASTPALKDVLKAWRTITKAADPWLDSLTSAKLGQFVINKGKPTARMYGNLLQRVIYHYWYHLGENMAIRQKLGHTNLADFVGNIDRQAPYRAE